MGRAADRPSRGPQKVGLLRVFRVVVAVARYCARNAGKLLLLVWLPCLLVAVCQIALDYLALAYPPRLPNWLLSPHFNPPTWLMAVAQTPWGAMVWAFVLADMARSNADRSPSGVRTIRARLKLSLGILLAAVIFSAINLLDGGFRALRLQLLASIYTAFEPSDELLNAIGRTGEVVQVIVMAAVVATIYLAIGGLLRSGIRGMAAAWRLTRHNRLRVFALFLLLSVAEIALNAATAPAISWLLQRFADELFWTFKAALIRQLVDLPFFLLWTVVYAVTVGIVLGAFELRPPAENPPSRAAKPI